MPSPTTTAIPAPALNRLSDRLRRESRAEVYFDPGMRGLYATDASLYQIEPIGVVVPRTVDDVVTTVSIAARSTSRSYRAARPRACRARPSARQSWSTSRSI